MASHAIERLQSRARAVRARAAIRTWQYRQRHLSAGVWFRLRRVLASARAVFVVSEAEARRLVAEGYAPEPCGFELAPEKTLVFVDEARLRTIADRREIPASFGPDFLAAAAIAMLRFDCD